MQYEYHGYTIDIPLHLYLDMSDDDLEEYCLQRIGTNDLSERTLNVPEENNDID